MKIGVDVRPLTVSTFGIGRYLEQVLIRLLKIAPPETQWFLYADRPLLVDFSEFPNVEVRSFSRPNLVMSLLRTQLVFSHWAVIDKLDLFWSPRHHLPLFLPANIVKVVTIHDLVWLKFPLTMRKKNLLAEKMLMLPSLTIADGVIAVSNATASDIREAVPGLSAVVQVIHEAVSAPPACSVEDVPGNIAELEKTSYFLFVGTLEPRKNLQRLMQAFQNLIRQPDLSGLKLVIVGAHGWSTGMPQEFADLEAQGSVIRLGYLEDALLHRLYASAVALVFPSLYEGFGLPPLEAMQYGVPVIAGNNSAMPEVIGEAGILVDVYSVDMIRQAMERIYLDPELRLRLSREAKQRLGQFSWDRAAQQTWDFFSSFGGQNDSATGSQKISQE